MIRVGISVRILLRLIGAKSIDDIAFILGVVADMRPPEPVSQYGMEIFTLYDVKISHSQAVDVVHQYICWKLLPGVREVV